MSRTLLFVLVQLPAAMAEDPRLTEQDVVRQYARFFFGAEREDDWAAALAGLERNWAGEPGRENGAIGATLAKELRGSEEVRARSACTHASHASHASHARMHRMHKHHTHAAPHVRTSRTHLTHLTLTAYGRASRPAAQLVEEIRELARVPNPL